jgi:PAP2 superfamily protein
MPTLPNQAVPTLTRFRVAMALVALLSSSAIARADVVLTWNEQAVKTFIGQGQSPFQQGRYVAIVQLAVFEAVNAITGDYEPYIGVVAPVGASVDAAAATAAYRVLKTYFPMAPDIDALYTASLAAIPAGTAKTNGIATGEAAAAAMIAKRVGDNSSPLTMSPPPVMPPVAGVWHLTLPPGCAATATGGANYNWKEVTPFGIASVVDYLLPPPPAITSNEFAKAYNQVKSVGAANSTERPPDRSDVARFYAASSSAYVFNLAARQVSQAEGLSVSENARLLALLNMASSDSLVASFYNKYLYNYWRPENAIRFDQDFGNKKVKSDTSYVPFITTPCFPSYPSNHASGSTGAAEILRRVFGEGGHSITMTNRLNASIANLTFTYTTFNQILDDVNDARVFGGIHYWFDQVAGNKLGREIATQVYKDNLRKIRP